MVGAINVLERGHSLLACGEGALRASMKQGTHRGKSSYLAECSKNPLPLGRGGCQKKLDGEFVKLADAGDAEVYVKACRVLRFWEREASLDKK